MMAIARRRHRRRRVVLSAVEGDAVDHAEANRGCGQTRMVEASEGA
jgi:hypothetical protein